VSLVDATTQNVEPPKSSNIFASITDKKPDEAPKTGEINLFGSQKTDTANMFAAPKTDTASMFGAPKPATDAKTNIFGTTTATNPTAPTNAATPLVPIPAVPKIEQGKTDATSTQGLFGNNKAPTTGTANLFGNTTTAAPANPLAPNTATGDTKPAEERKINSRAESRARQDY